MKIKPKKDWRNSPLIVDISAPVLFAHLKGMSAINAYRYIYREKQQKN